MLQSGVGMSKPRMGPLPTGRHFRVRVQLAGLRVEHLEGQGDLDKVNRDRRLPQ